MNWVLVLDFLQKPNPFNEEEAASFETIKAVKLLVFLRTKKTTIT
jgi:hypothetical protein